MGLRPPNAKEIAKEKGHAMESQSFNEYVQEWYKLKLKIKEERAALKTLTDKEMEMRKHIASAIQNVMGDEWKEGVNKFELPQGVGTVKINNKLTYEIVPDLMAAARESYERQNDRDFAFEALIRPKYELDKTIYNKLTDQAKRSLSAMISIKPSTPEVDLVK